MFVFFNDTATTEIYTLSLHDRSSDLDEGQPPAGQADLAQQPVLVGEAERLGDRALLLPDEHVGGAPRAPRSEEHTSELQSRQYLVCRLLLEKKKYKYRYIASCASQ